MAGDPKFESSQHLPDFPYARYAELAGLVGIRVDAARARSARRGRRRSRPADPRCSTYTPIPTCRRCRRTSPWSRRRHSRGRCCTATKTRRACCAPPRGKSWTVCCPATGESTCAPAAPVTSIFASAYTIPTDAPESDGTLEWHATTLGAGARRRPAGSTGSATPMPTSRPRPCPRPARPARRRDATLWRTCGPGGAMVRAIRNLGRPGIARWRSPPSTTRCGTSRRSCSGCRSRRLLGRVRDAVPVYGSGGFTSYDVEHLQDQLRDWVQQGIPRVKMKVGREPANDLDRVARRARRSGRGAELFVDANGALRP